VSSVLSKLAIDHGTYPGWQAHGSRGIPMCDDCRDAQARYVRDLRRRAHGIGMYHWPPIIRPDLADLSTLGAVLAQSFRGGA